MDPSIKALVFDVYGTLFDVNSVKVKGDELYEGRGEEISLLWRQKQVEYSFLRQLMGQYVPFSKITLDSLKYVLTKLDLAYTEENGQALMEAYKQLDAYPEVEGVLKQLKDKQLAVFSNGSRDMLEPLLGNSGLDSSFDEVVSVDDTKQYKPTTASYASVLNVLGVKREEVLFVSSNGWDISGAKNFGFQTAWVNRAGLPVEELGMEPDGVYVDLKGILE